MDKQRDDVVGGRYRLRTALGSGGFGRVWRAYDEVLRIDVAVKELRLPEDPSPGERRERLIRAQREALNAAKLRDHPNIVTVHDVIVEDGVPWIVMQLVRGLSLADRIKQGRVPVEVATDVAAALLKALDTAHDAGIVHRDVKPANVMITTVGDVLLTDFGIAVQQTDTTLTPSGMLIGSPEYMAPERARGEDGGPASDLFSLGVTLYHAVEKVSPFRRENHLATLQAVMNDEPPVPRHAGRLEPLITRLMAKDPADRPDVAEAVELLNSEPTRSLPPPPVTVREAPPREKPPEGPPKESKSGSGALGWAAFAAIVASVLYLTTPGFSGFVTEVFHLSAPAREAGPGGCLHHDPDAGTSENAWVQVPCFSAAADHTVLLGVSGDAGSCGRSGPGAGGTAVRVGKRTDSHTLCVRSKNGTSAAGGSSSSGGSSSGGSSSGGGSASAPPAPLPTAPATTPKSTPKPVPKPTPTPEPEPEPADPPSAPAFDPKSLNSRSTDTTPVTPAALLADSFVDSRNVKFTRRSGGVHPCLNDPLREPVRSILRNSGCDSAVIGTYLDQSNQIIVTVWVVPMTNKATAESVYNALDNSYSNSWGFWCPNNGAGSQVCSARSDAVDRAKSAGHRGQQHRYVLHSYAFYVNLTDSPSADPWVRSAADAAVSSAGPGNYRR